MKKIQMICSVIIVIALVILLINLFIFPLLDLAIRLVGIVMMVCLVMIGYSSFKRHN